MKTYNKLVRDKIPEIIKASGKTPIFEVMDEANYKVALLLKLVEEAKECYGAFYKSEITEELADLLEVIDTLCNAFNIDKNEVLLKQSKKKVDRGGFNERYCLVGVEE